MDLQLQDRVCLVTGASTGIGHATAVALAREGARLVLSARSLAALEDVARAVEALGSAPICLSADLSTTDGPAELANAALGQAGRVDVLVNNAGASRPTPMAGDEEAWAEAFRFGYGAPRALAEAVLPGMVARGWGRIVSLTGAILAKELNAASPPKAALESWSKATAATYASRGVTVNCVAPGRIVSAQIMDRLHPTEQSRAEYIARNIPAGRFGEASEAAAVIAFLCSGPASYVTGATIPVDGGALRYAF